MFFSVVDVANSAHFLQSNSPRPENSLPSPRAPCKMFVGCDIYFAKERNSKIILHSNINLCVDIIVIKICPCLIDIQQTKNRD